MFIPFQPLIEWCFDCVWAVPVGNVKQLWMELINVHFISYSPIGSRPRLQSSHEGRLVDTLDSLPGSEWGMAINLILLKLWCQLFKKKLSSGKKSKSIYL